MATPSQGVMMSPAFQPAPGSAGMSASYRPVSPRVEPLQASSVPMPADPLVLSPRGEVLSSPPPRVSTPAVGAGTAVPSLAPEAVDRVLLSKGYSVLGHVADDNTKGLMYTMVSTPKGQKVLVYVDTMGHTSVSPTDLTVVKTSPVSFIPSGEVKSGMLSAVPAGQSVAGVAMDCPGGVCVMGRDASQVPFESNLSIVRKPSPEVAVFGDGGVAYPVVPFSVISTGDPGTVSRSIDTAVAAISKQSTDTAEKQLSKMASEIKRLNAVWNDYVTTRKAYLSELGASKAELSGYYTAQQESIKRDPATATKLMESIGSVQRNAILRSSMEDGVRKIDESVFAELPTFERLTAKLEMDTKQYKAGLARVADGRGGTVSLLRSNLASPAGSSLIVSSPYVPTPSPLGGAVVVPSSSFSPGGLPQQSVSVGSVPGGMGYGGSYSRVATPAGYMSPGMGGGGMVPSVGASYGGGMMSQGMGGGAGYGSGMMAAPTGYMSPGMIPAPTGYVGGGMSPGMAAPTGAGYVPGYTGGPIAGAGYRAAGVPPAGYMSPGAGYMSSGVVQPPSAGGSYTVTASSQ